MILAGAVVTGELSGPALRSPVPVTARPGEPFEIPPLALTGLYRLSNIRLVRNGETILTGNPDEVTIEVIDKVIVSQVSARELSADEIQKKGIVIDEDNFQAYNFTAAFGFEDKKVTIDFPMVIPKDPTIDLPSYSPPSVPTFSPAQPPTTNLPTLNLALQSPSVGVAGLILAPPPDMADKGLQIPPIPGVIVIPGNVAYLNQFFSVLLMVANVAPGGSNLVVTNVKGEIVLPNGKDTVPDTGDEPLRMARLGDPPMPQPKEQPVVRPGPDGELGTGDDVPSLSPGDSGNAEYLVEGLREGTHEVEIKITATLEGLPVGPIEISGHAKGVVEVRNPTFSLTFTHPSTVTAGEEYDLQVTVTNTSDSVANFVSLNLFPRSISGAELLSDPTVEVDSIAAGDSATVAFRLLAKTTGNVAATSLDSEGISGRFEFRTAVGDLGIPLSPNTLVLPSVADSLPDDLKNAGIGLLGQALALATAPATPPGLLPITQQIVFDRATELSAGGQRIGVGEPLVSVARDLALDFTGNNFADIDPANTVSKSDYQGFDELLRQSKRGAAFTDVLAQIFGTEVQNVGPLEFQSSFAQTAASRPGHVSAITGSGGGPAPVLLSVIDPMGRRLGVSDGTSEPDVDIPFSEFFTLVDEDPDFSQFALLSAPSDGEHVVELVGTDSGSFDLGLVVPEGDSLRRLTYEGVSIEPSVKARVVFTIGDGAANTFSLEIDRDQDGTYEEIVSPSVNELVPDVGPALVSSVQFVSGELDSTRFGQVIGALFDERVSSDTAGDTSNYHVEDNEVEEAVVQPGNRVVLLRLRDGVGPFVPRELEVTGLKDPLGNMMDPPTSTEPITIRLMEGGLISGTVQRADGTTVPNVEVNFIQTVPILPSPPLFDEAGDLVITKKNADAEGAFHFDFVRFFPTRIAVTDPETGEHAEARTQPRDVGRELDIRIVFPGRGTLKGRTLASDGVTPLPKSDVGIHSLTKLDESFRTVSDANGLYSVSGIPAGSVSITAANQDAQAQTVQATEIPGAGAVVEKDLVLIPLSQVSPGNITGQVFRSNGTTPAVGVPVYTSHGGVSTTDSTGSYRIEGLPPGLLQVKSIDEATLEQGLTVANVLSGQDVTANILLSGGTGTVQGVVLDANRAPVADAVVGGGLSLGRTGPNGEFTLDDVPVGPRTISALDESTGEGASASVNLTRPGEVITVEIVLKARGSIAGQVFRSDGSTPVSGVPVYALQNLEGGIQQLLGSTSTNANGGYQFTGLPIGTYTVSAFLPGFSDGNVVRGPLTFKGQVLKLDVVFQGKGSVTGVVLDDDGKTPLGAKVGLWEPVPLISQGPGQPMVGVGFGRTEKRVINNDVSSGRFTFDDVFVGDVTVEAANGFSPEIMTASGRIEKPGDVVDLQLKLQSTSKVTGKVYLPDGITPVPNAQVVFDSGTLRGVEVRTGNTGDELGQYEFPLVNAGSFTLTATDPLTDLVGRKMGSVSAGRTANVDVRLLGLGAVVVEVTGAAGPIENAQVSLQRGSFPFDERSGVTGPDGKLAFDGGDRITEGTFSITVLDPATSLHASGSGEAVSGQTVTVPIEVRDDAGSVTGRFLRTDGTTAVPNAQIALTFQGRESFETTASDGTFQFDGVLKGDFSLEGFDPATGRRGRGSGVIASNGETAVADVYEVPQGTVTGRVVSSKDGSPIAGANVTIQVTGVLSQNLTSTSGQDGLFSFPGVPKGSFTLSATQPLTNFKGSSTGELNVEGEVVSVDVEIQVPKRGTVQGVVLGADGTPRAGATVKLGSRNFITDATGAFEFKELGLGTVRLVAVSADGTDAGQAQGELVFDEQVLSLDIQLLGTGRVTGTVTDAAGTAVPFANVTLSRQSSQPISVFSQRLADDQGHFSFDSVLIGDLSVKASKTFSNATLAGSASGTLAAPGDELELDVALQPAGDIVGRVVRQDGVTPAVGMALQLALGGTRIYGTTDETGAFSFPSLPLGTYQLKVEDLLADGLAFATAVLQAQGDVVDLGDIVLDEEPPSVIQVSPENGAAMVPRTQPISVVFSEPMKTSTIDAANLQVSTAAGLVGGSWAISGANATFTPAAPFPDFTRVTLKVTRNALDLVNRPLAAELVSSFVTADATPPAVVSATPPPSSTGVEPTAVIRIGYSEALGTAPAVGLSLNGAPVPGQGSLVLNDTVVLFVPDAPLVPNSTYDVTVGPAADVFGNPQASGLSYSFATLDVEPPEILSLTSSKGTDVLEGDVVSIGADLGSATDVARVEFFVNGALAFTDMAAPYAFDLTINEDLAPTATVSARATDKTGNVSLAVQIVLNVTLDNPPTITILSPPDGTVVNTGGQVTVEAQAEDDFGLQRIDFQATGQTTSSRGVPILPPATSRAATFTFSVPAGAKPGSPITVRAVAKDTRNVSSAIASIDLVVADSTPPTVTIASPVASTIVDPGTDLQVLVTANDNGVVSSLGLEASGAVSFSENRAVNPPAANAAATFTVPVPSGAASGEPISLLARATDGAGLDREATVSVRTRDVVLPTVSLSVSGATDVEVGDTVTLQVTAGDNFGVTQLELLVDGVTTATRDLGEIQNADETFTFVVPETAALGSTISVAATAVDRDGNQASTAPVSLNVIDRTAPSVTIVSPKPQTLIDPGASFDVTVSASDANGVTSIECTATGAVEGTVDITVDPPEATVSRTCTFTVPPDAPGGASVQLGVTVLDSSGNEGSSSVTLEIADVVPPTVLSVTPADGASNVEPDVVVEVEFDEAINVATFQSGFTLVGPDGDVSGSVSTASGGRIARFTPSTALTIDASYTATVSAGITDLAGNALGAPVTSTFQVRPDTVGPCLVEIGPANGAIERSLTPFVFARFDEPVKRASVGVTLTPDVSFEIGMTQDDTVAFVELSEPLAQGTSYTVAWGSTVTDLAGNAIRPASECGGVSETYGFRTGTARITKPATGTMVIEGQTIDIASSASPDLGIHFVRYRQNGTVIGAGAAPDFSFSHVVPSPVTLESTVLELSGEGVAGASGNVARGRPVSESGPDPLTPRDPAVAVDGNPDGVFDDGSVTLSAPAPRAWWGVDLGAHRIHDRVEISLRTDCCQERNRIAVLMAASPFVDADFEQDELPAEYSNGARELYRTTDAFDSGPIVIDGPFFGRYLRIASLETGQPLSLAEVDVEARPIALAPISLPILNAADDQDGDGLSNGEELAIGTDPFNEDTDGDGLLDGEDPAPLSKSPVVVSVSPPDGALGVNVTSTVQLAFSRALDPATVRQETVFLHQQGSTTAVEAVLALSPNGTAVTLTPTRTLAVATTYVVTVTTAVATPDGAALVHEFDSSFTTGDFAIVRPHDGSAVVENREMTLEAQASSSLGVVSVVFSVNGQDLPPVTGPPFIASFSVPSAAVSPSLTIAAAGRDASGQAFIFDQIQVDVVAQLRFVPRLLGVAPGETREIDLQLSAPSSENLTVDLSTMNSEAASVSPAQVTLFAGQTSVPVSVTGLEDGSSTSVVATSRIGDAGAVVSVSTLPAGRSISVSAPSVGIATRAAPSAGLFVLGTSATGQIVVPVLGTPADTDVAVSVTSSDPSVANVVGTPVIPAGGTSTMLDIVTGGSGVVTLRIEVDGVVKSVTLVVGAPPSGRFAPTQASPVSIAARAAPLAAVAVAPVNGTASLIVPLLSAPAAGDQPVTATSSNPSVAHVVGTPVVPNGTQSAALDIETGASGTAILTIAADGEAKAIKIFVGTPPAGSMAPVRALPVGVATKKASSAGVAVAPENGTSTVLAFALSAPAPSDLPVFVTSSNPAIVAVTGAPILAAGSQFAAIDIQTGATGKATLTLTVGGEAHGLQVYVGVPPSGSLPANALPVGVAARALPSAGLSVTQENGVTLLRALVLSAPASADEPVLATSSDPGIAQVTGTPFVSAGEQEVQLEVETGSAGTAVITLTVSNETRALKLIVGVPAPGGIAPVTALPVYVEVQQ